MNILVIGNGFDLAHDLPTSYREFLDFTKAYEKYKDVCMAKEGVKEEWEKADDANKEFIVYFANLYDQKKKIFLELNEQIKDNVWFKHFYAVKLEKKWVDFEREIANIIKTLDDVRIKTIVGLKRDGRGEKLTVHERNILAPFIGQPSFFSSMEPIDNLKDKLLDDLNRLTRCLEIYLCDYVKETPVEKKLPDMEGLEIDAIVSFNYTNTYRDNYVSDPTKEVKCDFIHGEAKMENTKETCNMVIGIDEYLKGTAKEEDNEYIQFKKFFQRIYKGTGCDYVDWLNDCKTLVLEDGKMHPELNIYIYGHSLDATDKDILKALITAENAKVVIFHHSKKALEQQIINLTKVITENELIRRTGGIYKSIEFRSTKKA